jgi:two-component system cell cycle sensor histidine kinase/response regulator CckA
MLTPEPVPQYTILLVEDNELVMEMTREILERSGYRVVPTYLPAVALKMALQDDFRADLLLTDVVMPQMNGPELCRRLQKKRPGLPVLFMSGYSNGAISDIMPGNQAGFLAKPFTATMLLEQVARILAG